jgi:hypothetical protein
VRRGAALRARRGRGPVSRWVVQSTSPSRLRRVQSRTPGGGGCVDARACARRARCATASQAMGSRVRRLSVLMQSSPIAAASSLPAVSVSGPAVNVQLQTLAGERWLSSGSALAAAPPAGARERCTGLDPAAAPETERWSRARRWLKRVWERVSFTSARACAVYVPPRLQLAHAWPSCSQRLNPRHR